MFKVTEELIRFVIYTDLAGLNRLMLKITCSGMEVPEHFQNLIDMAFAVETKRD